MKIYIAAPWVRKEDAKKYGQQVEALGHEVTSRWFHHVGDPNDNVGLNVPIENVQKQAGEDVEDIHRSNGMIVLNLERSEGKAVETGIALEIGMPIAYIGPRSNVFQSFCFAADSIEAAVKYIEDYYRER